MICCIRPAERFLEETRSTLAFASRAKLVTTHATVNEVLDEAAKIRRLEKEVMLLRQLTNGNTVNLDAVLNAPSNQMELVDKIEGYERRIKRLQYLATTSGAYQPTTDDAFSGGDENASPNAAAVKKPTQVYSSSKAVSMSSMNDMAAVDIDSLRRSFVLPMDMKDSHEVMVRKEEALKVNKQ